MNGTYGFAYCGSIGVGTGIFRITNSELVGADYAGATYLGQVVLDQATGEIDVSFEMTVPPGVQLVQGTSPQGFTVIRGASVRVPPEFGDGKPFEVYMPPGPVTLMVRRVSDDWAWLADGFTVKIEPKR